MYAVWFLHTCECVFLLKLYVRAIDNNGQFGWTQSPISIELFGYVLHTNQGDSAASSTDKLS